MADRTLNPEPSLGAVSAAQLRMVTDLQKRDFIILAVLVAGLIGLATWGQMQMDADYDGSDTIPIFQGLSVPLALLGAFWPLGVWRADSPDRRGYFWSLPVDRRRHTLVRTAIGWAVLMTVSLLVMAIAVASFTPSVIRFEEVRFDLAGAWQPLATATLAYVTISALAVLFDSPIRWLAFAWLGVLGLFIVAEAGDLDGLSDGVESAIESLFIALGGPIITDGSVSEWSRHYLVWLAIGTAALLAALLWRHEEK